MNNKLHEYLKKAGEEISLTHEEREKMRSVLHAYMAMKPLPSHGAQMSPLSGWSIERVFASRAVAASLIIAVFASSAGISYAAEGALPGDLLYPVKTHVNEPVRGAFAVSPSAKTAWAMSVASERIKEATMLAAEGRLNSEHQQELQANFESHARKASENISAQASASPEASAEIGVRFEAQLSEYERVLAEVGSAKGIAVSELASSVRRERERVVAVRARAQERSEKGTPQEKKEAVSRMRDAAKKQFEDSSDIARALSGKLASSTIQSAALQLESASATIADGENLMNADSEPQAMDAFREALSETEKIGVFLKTSSDVRKRTGIIIKETERARQQSVKTKRDDSGQKVQENRKSRGESAEIRSTPSTVPVNVQNPEATTTVESKTHDAGKATESVSATSSQSGSGERGTIDVELHSDVEATQEIKNAVPPVQSVLPVYAPSPTLP